MLQCFFLPFVRCTHFAPPREFKPSSSWKRRDHRTQPGHNLWHERICFVCFHLKCGAAKTEGRRERVFDVLPPAQLLNSSEIAHAKTDWVLIWLHGEKQRGKNQTLTTAMHAKTWKYSQCMGAWDKRKWGWASSATVWYMEVISSRVSMLYPIIPARIKSV